MACDCITEMDAKLSEHNTRLAPTFLFGGGRSEMRVHLTTQKINTRNRESMSAIATFCPFCGVAYRADAQ